MDTSIDTFLGHEQGKGAPERRFGGRRDVRIRIVLNDQVNMNMAATLNLSDGGALIAAGVNIRPGTPITIFPLMDEMEADLFELKGKVVRTYEDIMVSPYSDDRFCIGVSLELTQGQRDALRRYVGTAH